jgi:hypothetical protein
MLPVLFLEQTFLSTPTFSSLLISSDLRKFLRMREKEEERSEVTVLE